MKHYRFLAITMVVLGLATFTGITPPAGAGATRLDDADEHLRRARELIAAAEPPRTNRTAFDRYQQNALAYCDRAREQIRLARQAHNIPPGYLPQR